MSVIVVGPGLATIPWAEPVALVSIKRAWAGAWESSFSLVPLAASRHACGQDLDALTLQRRYGPAVKGPLDEGFSARSPIDLLGAWVRVELAGGQGLYTVWIGRIEAETRAVQGSESGRQGTQQWTAFGPLQILRKAQVHHSFWDEDNTVQELGWVPDVNLYPTISARIDPQTGMLVGNRSASKLGESYLFGGTDYWSNYDHIEYLLARFVEQSGGPTWTIGGQTDILRDLITITPTWDVHTVADLLASLIPPAFGIDYQIAATGAGFEVRVFALTANEVSFGGETMPRNPNTTRISGSTTVDMLDCRIERSRTQFYDRLRVVGERVKSVFSLSAPEGTLVPMWTDTLETDYKTAINEGIEEEDKQVNDAYRAQDRFRAVYRMFRASDGWDWMAGRAAPKILLDGGSEEDAARQTGVRATLPELLLKEGWNYGEDPPVNENPSGEAVDFLAPFALVQDPELVSYLPVDKLSVLRDLYLMNLSDMGLSVLENQWGVMIHPSPNHALARNHWTDAKVSAYDPMTEGVDWEGLIVTIAAETDQRLEMGLDLPEAFASGDGSTMVVSVPGAEFWWLSPSTVIGVDSLGQKRLSPESGVVLRDDSSKLALIAAGALSRYLNDRVRASFTCRRLVAWTMLLGTVLTVVEEGGDLQHIGAPITSIRWDFQARTTQVLTGFAS